ncbi:MAG TPA: hypothetical protein VGD68_13995 [Streptosporangiaceae bacterium]
MPATGIGPLPRGLLSRLTGPGQADPARLAADLTVLAGGGYLKLALPSRFGGAGLGLTDLACAQRQLAARAPASAWAVNAHHAWVGAAADALASGDVAGPGPGWILGEAARGRVFADFGGGQDQAMPLLGVPPGVPADVPPEWDWLALRSVDTRGPGRPAIEYGFVHRTRGDYRPVARQPRGAPGSPAATLIAGRHAWGLSLAGMTCYAVARREFGRAVTQAQRSGRSLDRWPRPRCGWMTCAASWTR